MLTIAIPTSMPSSAPTSAGYKVVRQSLVDERLHQVPPLHPDCAGDAHLGLSLRGKHDEDEEDQHHPGHYRKQPEDNEDGHYAARESAGQIQQIGLDVLDGENLQLAEQGERRKKLGRVIGGGLERDEYLRSNTFVRQVGHQLGVQAVRLQQIGGFKQVILHIACTVIGQFADGGHDLGRAEERLDLSSGVLVGQQRPELLGYVLAKVGPRSLVTAVRHEDRVDLTRVFEEGLGLR